MNHELKAAELRVALLKTQAELLQYKILYAQQELKRLQDEAESEKEDGPGTE